MKIKRFVYIELEDERARLKEENRRLLGLSRHPKDVAEIESLRKQLADLHKMLEQAFPIRVELGTVTAPEDCFAITVSDWKEHFTAMAAQEADKDE